MCLMNSHCKDRGKPFQYVGDVPEGGFPAGQAPWCECGLKYWGTTTTTGWRCPTCGRNNAPWIAQCPCSPPKPYQSPMC